MMFSVLKPFVNVCSFRPKRASTDDKAREHGKLFLSHNLSSVLHRLMPKFTASFATNCIS